MICELIVFMFLLVTVRNNKNVRYVCQNKMQAYNFSQYKGITKHGKVLQQQKQLHLHSEGSHHKLIQDTSDPDAFRVFSVPQCECPTFPNKNHGRTLICFPPTMVFPSHSMLCNTSVETMSLTNSRINQTVFKLINNLTEWGKKKETSRYAVIRRQSIKGHWRRSIRQRLQPRLRRHVS